MVSVLPKKFALSVKIPLFNQFDNLQQVYIDLTVSFGVAEASSAEQLNNAIMAADSKLYLAKEQGRNQVQG